ncbi:MAG TPA: TetR/AcrR family transcriptional regulator [Rhodoblastus sp.]|nr:TetR/AcrR family transcriptional regulator [Rhodoblastus sp.]
MSETAAQVPSKRRQASEARRRAILDAAFDVFIAEGFKAARLDDIARRAGVAKGTLYLFSKDKDDLFEQVALDAVAPVLERLTHLAGQTDLPFAMLLTGMFTLFEREVLATKRREIFRLIIAEGARFPAIAEFYHREVVSRGLTLVERAAERAHARGEIPSYALARYPQLLFGPLLVSVVWRSLFEPYQPLDVAGMLAAHRAMLLGTAAKAREP